MRNPLVEAIMDAFRSSQEYQSLATRMIAIDAEVTRVSDKRCAVRYFDRLTGKEAQLLNVPIAMPSGAHTSVRPGDRVVVVFPAGDISMAICAGRILQDSEKTTIPGSSTLYFTSA